MTAKKDLPIYKRSLFYWVRQTKLSLQLLLVVLILGLVFLRVLPLEIQKRIVNEVLAVGDVNQLVVYCLIFLLAVVLSNILKLAVNGLQTVIGQSALTDMRRELYQHILRLPLSFFRKTPTGTVVASLVTELAASANFVGAAVAVPLSNILTLVAIGVYLIWLNALLGIVTLSIYPIALFVVPLVQRGVNNWNRRRVDSSNKMASRITESVTGISEIHAQGSFQSEEHSYNSIIERLLKIRIIWTLYRYGVKVTNNFFVGLGPVVVMLLGGYLLMQGETELGSIVAFLSAQEKLYDPWKEMIDFYQTQQDASVRYNKVMQIFEGDSEFTLIADRLPQTPHRGRIEIQDLELVTPNGIKLLDQVNLTIEAGEHLALVGFSGSGKSTLAKCIAQLYFYTGGEVLIDGRSVALMSKEEIIRSIGFISQDPIIFSGTISDNLLYACNAIEDFPDRDETHEPTNLDDKIAVLQQAGVFVDILRFGLNTVLDLKAYPELEERFLKVRANFQENFGSELAEHVEFYHQDNYLYHSTILENIIFGSIQDNLGLNSFEKDRAFLKFLKEANLSLPLLETGAELLNQTVDILGREVLRDPVFFEQTPVAPEEYDSYLELVDKLAASSISGLLEAERLSLLNLAFRYVPARHKIIALQPLLEKLLLSGRQEFRRWSGEHMDGTVSFYRDSEYIRSQSILNNIFFGSLTSDSPNIEDRVNQCIVQLLIEEDLLEQVADIGMEFDVGNRGDKLSGGQQQKLSIARVLLKKPKVLIMDEATSALDNNSQSRIQNLIEKWKGSTTVISVIHRLDLLSSFDKVAVMKSGKIIESGVPEKLLADQGVLHELVHGKKR
ncbi:MAG: ABC transporter ATP-binding protein/permease [Desulfofustis sp.]|nr:ABC transporter ATP-binding protein/permease [Desulfofustis sp.]